ncbi:MULTISPECIES: hypothetical protein [unclassified Microcystis]|jgi:hypothetical protein|uniref:VMAP-C domain-containing protein n=1 Tax=unclassified Microcystis TaxID=2643300 RepID=UPI0022C929ED|nr:MULTISPECIES: hypothetical protein [unclassified Microcystis]MCA2693034.1 hypothetical protein [Microcystis sp. M034S2]MCA2749536.1 hypothetical protein [Microcystis sp. M144S2]MCZ8200669.1 hypothetical protein [Microcystis sp. LE19-55.1A]MCZ8306970.1 hypothetical protein [Microcystis sp. LE19-98.1E]
MTYLVQNDNLESISLDSLRNFDFPNISQESVRKAYQDALPTDADLWDLAEGNTEEILKKLAEFRKLFQFFQGLSQDKDLPKEFRELFEKTASELAVKKHDENVKYLSENKLQSYLIATLYPNENNGNQFLLNAWLIVDDLIGDLSKFQSLLDKNEQQIGKICNLNEVSLELSKFLEKALRLLRGKNYCLTIEFFLPTDLMGMEIDRWKISDPVDDDITLGIKYPIRLRSLERLNLRYLDHYLSQWRESWHKVRKLLENKPNQDCFETLSAIENFNWKVLKVNLNKKIGLKVTCHHPKSIQKDLFKAILQATTPLAIWTRTDILNLDQVTAIDEVLTSQPLCHLCESVRQTREKADAQTGEHLGHHLALLWENPYRLTPDIMRELIQTGQ